MIGLDSIRVTLQDLRVLPFVEALWTVGEVDDKCRQLQDLRVLPFAGAPRELVIIRGRRVSVGGSSDPVSLRLAGSGIAAVPGRDVPGTSGRVLHWVIANTANSTWSLGPNQSGLLVLRKVRGVAARRPGLRVAMAFATRVRVLFRTRNLRAACCAHESPWSTTPERVPCSLEGKQGTKLLRTHQPCVAPANGRPAETGLSQTTTWQRSCSNGALSPWLRLSTGVN